MRNLDATRSAAAATAVAAQEHRRSVRIAGVGLLTPLGLSAASTWDALIRGERIMTHSRVPIDFAHGECRAAALALRAAREAMECARWVDTSDQRARTAVLVGTSKGPVESWLSPPLHMAASPYMVGGLTLNGLGQIASAIGHEFHIVGPRLTLSAACASGLHALIRAVLMLRSGEADRALVVATESSLHSLFQASFKRLGVLASPDTGCRPFDESRNGFLMSESAAALCLEGGQTSDDTSSDRAQSIYMDRCALGGDATHLTSSDPRSATLRRLLSTVFDAGPLDLVHAHGTATIANDATELAAIESCLPPGSSPAIYSHKGALGHSLGAAGLISVALNCLMHRHGVVLPNVQTHMPLPAERVTLSSRAEQRFISRSACLAAGFGGPVAAVSLVSSNA